MSPNRGIDEGFFKKYLIYVLFRCEKYFCDLHMKDHNCDFDYHKVTILLSSYKQHVPRFLRSFVSSSRNKVIINIWLLFFNENHGIGLYFYIYVLNLRCFISSY